MFETSSLPALASYGKDEVDDSENVIRKWNLGFKCASANFKGISLATAVWRLEENI